jgi:hypothetical protein
MAYDTCFALVLAVLSTPFVAKTVDNEPFERKMKTISHFPLQLSWGQMNLLSQWHVSGLVQY